MAWILLDHYPINTRNHACAVCSSDVLRPIPGAPTRHERAAETGLFIDGEGMVVICESCLVDIGTQLGLRRASEYGRLQSELEAAKIGLADHRNHLEQVRRENGALRTVLHVRDNTAPGPSQEKQA